MTIPGGANALLLASTAKGDFKIERSLRFNDADTPSLTRTVSTSSNRRTFTFSFWVKRSELGRDDLYKQGSDPYTMFLFRSDDVFGFDSYNGSLDFDVRTARKFRDFGAWMHIVLAVDTTQATDSNRVKLYINGVQETLTPQSAGWPDQNYETYFNHTSPNNAVLGNSCNGYLAEWHMVDGQQLAATDFGEYDDNNNWNPKEFSGTHGTNGFFLNFSDNSSRAALGTDGSGNSNTWTVNNLDVASVPNYTANGTISGSFYTSAGGAASKMFDGDASTGAFSQTGTATFTFGGSTITASSSLQVRAFKGDAAGANVLVNGTNISSLLNAQSSGGYSTVNITSTLGGAPITLSNVSVVNANNGSGNIAQIFVDGTELVDGTGAAGIDSLIDTPTSYEADSGNNGGNYATLNANALRVNGGTISNGNLTLFSDSNKYIESRSTIAASAFNNYSELTITTAASNSDVGFGVGDQDAWVITGGGSYLVYRESGLINRFPGNTSVATVASFTQGDVLGMAVDSTNVKFYKNGSLQGTYAHQLTGNYFVTLMNIANNDNTEIDVNFGQRPFAYTPPTGYKSLCTTNLPEPAVADGSTAFDVKLYTGNNGTQNITGLNFNLDLLWIKSRSTPSSGHYHHLFDSVRGTSNGYFSSLHSNTTETENTYPGSTFGGVTSFNSDGFTLSNAGGSTILNTSAHTYVAWAWDAGTSTVSNTDGNITSSVRANPTIGFSILNYVGNSSGGSGNVGHGLNATPDFIIFKTRDAADHWAIYNSALGLAYVEFTTSGQGGNAQNRWSSLPTSSVIHLGSDTNINTKNHLMYVWSAVEGYSSFGKYTGNGSTDGPFVFTGMRPKWLVIKRTDGTKAWQLMDTSRDPINPADTSLFPSGNDAESGNNGNWYIDILSNGFKIRTSHDSRNASNGTYIYAAFAEHPFKTARAR